MNNDSKKELWFRAKRYGWGWYPISWQGWVITILYIFVLIRYGIRADNYAHSNSDFLIGFSIPFIISTVLFLVVCYWKGEYPHWSWGDSKKDTDTNT